MSNYRNFNQGIRRNVKNEKVYSITSQLTRKKPRVVFILVTLLLSFLFVELLCRGLLFYRTPTALSFDDEIVFTFKPHSKYYGRKINNIGCLGDDIVEKKKDEVRIFLLGGSTSLTTAYVNTVKKILSQRYPERYLNVISCGKQRYTSYINRVNLEKNLLQHQPDIVVNYMGINDNFYNTFPWVEDLSNIGYFNWASLKESIFFRMFYYYIIEKEIRSNPAYTRDEIRSGGIFEKNLRSIIQTARDNGISVVLSTFAISFPPENEAMKKRIIQTQKPWEHSLGHYESAAMGVEVHNNIMRKLAREYDLPLGKVDEAIPRNLDYFDDICHLTNKGRLLLGEKIANTIIQSGYIE